MKGEGNSELWGMRGLKFPLRYIVKNLFDSFIFVYICKI